ncbi:MAG: hypothetical protein V3T57_10480, partial [Kiloniellales bacterium]
ITAVGCPFFNRCPVAIEGTCDKEVPPIRVHGTGHQIACHLTLDEMEESESAPQKILTGFERTIDEEDKARKHRH